MEGGIFPGIERSYINNDYIDAVLKAGGIPIIIPVNMDDNIISSQIKCVDGVIIPGGFDVNPLAYGEEPLQSLGFVYPEIDEFNLKAIDAARNFNKPILGICRGVQILNVFYGGTLYQDLSLIENCSIKHIQSSKRFEATHTAKILPESRLYNILGEKTAINSYHHQAVNRVAKGFIAPAFSQDGVVEAIEKAGDEFVMGVQWHPEMMVTKYPAMLQIFKELVQACKK